MRSNFNENIKEGNDSSRKYSLNNDNNNKNNNNINKNTEININNKMKNSFTTFHNGISYNKKFPLPAKTPINNLTISNQEFKNLNTNYLKEKLTMEFKCQENTNNHNTERLEQISDLKKSPNDYKSVKQTEKNDNLLINKNNYLLSQSSGQREGSENQGNNNNKKQKRRSSKMNFDSQNQNHNTKISNYKVVDPSQIYLTPTQKIYKTLNDNILFFNKYYSKKK